MTNDPGETSAHRAVRAIDELPEVPDAERIELPLTDVVLGGYLWWRNSALAVVTLHGWEQDASSMLDVARDVAATQITCVSLSTRGWRGSTGKDDYGRSDPADLIEVVTWLRARGVERVALWGFSMGGLIALLTAAKCSQEASLKDELAGVIAVSPVTDLPSFYRDTNSDTAREYFDRTLQAEDWTASSPLTHAEDIRCPLLIVVGANDRVCPPDQGKRLAAAVPSSRLVELDMRHRPSTEQWAQILEIAISNRLLENE